MQECLGNVQRHSEARTAWVSLRRDPTEVVLQVRDDGHGISRPAGVSQPAGISREQGFGLRTLAERMKQLAGRLEVESGPAGTRVTAILPVSGQ